MAVEITNGEKELILFFERAVEHIALEWVLHMALDSPSPLP